MTTADAARVAFSRCEAGAPSSEAPALRAPGPESRSIEGTSGGMTDLFMPYLVFDRFGLHATEHL